MSNKNYFFTRDNIYVDIISRNDENIDVAILLLVTKRERIRLKEII